MSSINPLKKNNDFVAIYQTGKSYANRYLVMYAVKNGGQANRLGISVSKKVGNSVVRHRIKRLVKEACRLHAEQFGQGYDLVVIARKAAKGKGYSDIESAVMHLAKMHHLLI